MTKLLAAYTPPGFNPPFVNLAIDGDEVVVTIRDTTGVMASVKVPLHEWKQVMRDATGVMANHLRNA